MCEGGCCDANGEEGGPGMGAASSLSKWPYARERRFLRFLQFCCLGLKLGLHTGGLNTGRGDGAGGGRELCPVDERELELDDDDAIEGAGE